MNLADFIKLYRAKLDEPQSEQEARWLLMHTLGLDSSAINLSPELEIDKQQQEQLDDALSRRQHGEPLAYIMGEWEFFGNRFYVGPEVLIPRPDSESIIMWLFERRDACPHKARSLLDVGCGCGALAITLELRCNSWHIGITDKVSVPWTISASDISPAALAVARRNLKRYSCDIKLYHSDLLAAIPREKKYDVILANLPYIGKMELMSLPELKFEPRRALTDGADGLQLLRRLFRQAKHHLKHNGLLVVEHGYRQGTQVAAMAKQEGYVAPAKIQDIAERQRGLAVKYIG